MNDTALPEDPAILLSYINTKLRDEYSATGLDGLCADMNVDRAELERRLETAGFEYNASQNKFW